MTYSCQPSSNESREEIINKIIIRSNSFRIRKSSSLPLPLNAHPQQIGDGQSDIYFEDKKMCSHFIALQEKGYNRIIVGGIRNDEPLMMFTRHHGRH